MVFDETVGERDVGSDVLVAGLSVHRNEREARIASLLPVERRALDESMNALLAIDLSAPCGVHPAQRVGESLGVYSVRRFNLNMRHLVILPQFAQGALRNAGTTGGTDV